MLADSIHYFVRHIYVYQVNNAKNIDIHVRTANAPTTIKVFVHGIITAGVVNDPNGAIKLCLDNRHACPEIMAILEDDLNVLIGGTCSNNVSLPSLLSLKSGVGSGGGADLDLEVGGRRRGLEGVDFPLPAANAGRGMTTMATATAHPHHLLNPQF